MSQNEMTLTEVYNNLQKLIRGSVDEIKSQILDIHKKVQQIEEAVTTLKIENKNNTKKINSLETEVKKNNLILFGIEEEIEEDLLNKVLNFFDVTLNTKICASEIDCVYRFGQKQKVRPILVKFVSRHKKSTVLKKGVLLKNTKISISNDRTKEDREIQKILREHLKIARNENVKAKIVRNKLQINNKYLSVDQLIAIGKEGLLVDFSSSEISQNDSSSSNSDQHSLVHPRKISADKSQNNIGPSKVEPSVTIQNKESNTKLSHSNFSSYITRSKKVLETSQGRKN